MKKCRMLPGCQEPALIDAAVDDAVGADVVAALSNSRRVKAIAAQANGEATGSPWVPSPPSHDTTVEGTTGPESTEPTSTAATAMPVVPEDFNRDSAALSVAAALTATAERPVRALAGEWLAGKDFSPRAAREGPRADVLVEADETDDASVVAEPVDPAEPVVSANAIGIAATAEPTPNATANAPTRPTTRAKPAGSVTDHRRYSIARTCHFDPRRTALTDWTGCADGIESSPHIRCSAAAIGGMARPLSRK